MICSTPLLGDLQFQIFHYQMFIFPNIPTHIFSLLILFLVHKPFAQTFHPIFLAISRLISPSRPETHARPATAPPAPFSPLPFHNITSFPIPVFNPLSIQLPYSAHTSSLIPPPFVVPYVSGIPHQPIMNTPLHALPPPSTALHNPPIQYVYCLPTPSAPFSPTSHSSSHTPSRTLPSVSHISILNSKSDFHTWDEGVTSLLRHLGLLGHILDPSEPLDLSRPDRVPLPEPILPASPTPAALTAFTRWWDDDNIAQHVLVARLGSTPRGRGLLPSSSIANRSARSIYSTLAHYYGLCSWSDGSELLNTLNALICTPGRVQEYVSKWCTGISRLRSARFPINVKLLISNFVRGLPITPAFNTLRADLSSRISQAGEHDMGVFIAVTETALDLEATFRTAAQAQNPRSAPPPRPSVHVAASVTAPAPAPLSNVAPAARTSSTASGRPYNPFKLDIWQLGTNLVSLLQASSIYS